MDDREAAQLLDELGEVRAEAHRRYAGKDAGRALAAAGLGFGAVALAMTVSGLDLRAGTVCTTEPTQSPDGLTVQVCEFGTTSGTAALLTLALLFTAVATFIALGPRGGIRRWLNQPVTVGRMIVLLAMFFFGVPLLLAAPLMLLTLAGPLTLGLLAILMLVRAADTRGTIHVPTFAVFAGGIAAIAMTFGIAVAIDPAGPIINVGVPAVAAITGTIVAVRWRRQDHT